MSDSEKAVPSLVLDTGPLLDLVVADGMERGIKVPHFVALSRYIRTKHQQNALRQFLKADRCLTTMGVVAEVHRHIWSTCHGQADYSNILRGPRVTLRDYEVGELSVELRKIDHDLVVEFGYVDAGLVALVAGRESSTLVTADSKLRGEALRRGIRVVDLHEAVAPFD